MVVDRTLSIGTDERCCGGCKHFMYEDSTGEGYCGNCGKWSYCGLVCEKFEPEEE